MSDALWPHEPQPARLPCASPTPGVCSNSCPLSRWCYATISSSVVPFSSCRPLLLLPSIFPSIRVFSNESLLCIRWPNYWSFSFNISPSNEYSGLISFRSLLVELEKNYQSMVDSQCCVNLLVVGSYALLPSGQSIYFSYLELLVLSDFSLPSHLFIYSVIYLNKYRLTDICFMFVIYFLAQGDSALVPGSFSGGSCVLWPYPQAVTISLLPSDTECSRLILFISSFNPRLWHFSRERCSFY